MTQKKRVNYQSAAQTAEGFHDAAILLHYNSELLLSAIPKGQNIDMHTFAKLFGFSSASVVLHSFSLELILKALQGENGQLVPKTHHLGELFSDLPVAVKIAAEQLYVDAVSKQKEEKGLDTLVTLLNDCANAFEEWRYTYEGTKTTLSGRIGDMQIAFDVLYEIYSRSL